MKNSEYSEYNLHIKTEIMYTETSQLDNHQVEQYHLPIQQHQHLG